MNKLFLNFVTKSGEIVKEIKHLTYGTLARKIA